MQKKYNSERFDSDATPHMIHAEVSALSHIINNDINWNNVEVYTYRELKNGSIALAKPCKSCMSLIKDLGIRKIHYTTNDGYATEILK